MLKKILEFAESALNDLFKQVSKADQKKIDESTLVMKQLVVRLNESSVRLQSFVGK